MSTTGEPLGPVVNRAVCLVGSGETRLEQGLCPQPGPGELLLRLRGCGLCGTDLFKIRAGNETIGRVLGHEVVGTVAAIGEGVDRFEIGQRVVTPHHVPCGSCHLCRIGSQTLCPVFRQDQLTPGGFSDYFVVRSRAVEQAARVIPDQLTDAAALFLEPAACVLRGIDRAGLSSAAATADRKLTALILGAGSMGLLHLLILRSLSRRLAVVISDPLTERRQLAHQLGATLAVEPGDVEERLHGATDGRGADFVFDTVGRPAVLRDAMAASREGATLVLFAHADPGEQLGLELNLFFKSERRLIGTYSGGPAEQETIWRMLIEGRLDPSPLVTHILPLSRFDEGVQLTASRRALKVVFVPEEEGEPAFT